jgi:hypothetical protein
VVHLVALLQAAQDGDRVFHRGLAHVHRLEAPLERRVLLHVLAVLVERGRAHHVQLAPRQRRLQHVGGVHRPLRRSGAHKGVQLVNEHDVLPLGARDLLEDGLQTLFELAPVLGPRDQRAQVEGDEVLVAQGVGHVAVHDPLGQAFDDRRLPHSGLADQHRIVLGAPRQHLDHPANLLVPADHWIELALARLLGEVARKPLERLVLALRLLIGHAVRTAHALQRRQQVLAIHPRPGEQLPRRGPLLFGQREQQVLGGHVSVAEGPGLLLRPVEDPGQLP